MLHHIEMLRGQNGRNMSDGLHNVGVIAATLIGVMPGNRAGMVFTNDSTQF
jgi:hypothetical protein